MPTSQKAQRSVAHSRISHDELYFDDRNPRFQGEAGGATQDEILGILWRDFAVDEIALSIAKNGFFEHEPLLAALEKGRLVVIEGNRRLAAVRLLTSAEARLEVGAADLPTITRHAAEKLADLPVVKVDRRKIWEYVGFKHVNGPQPWESFSKAQYIAWVHNELGVPLEDIASHIGDKHATVLRFYRALMALEQAEKAGTYSREDRWKGHFSFSHLYTGLDYAGIQKFIGLSPTKSFKVRPVPPSKTEQLGQLCEWLFGRKSKNRPPLVQSQNPDLRILDEILQSKDGTAALRRGLPLKVSLDISKGDDRLFRESMVGAKQSLQDARGKLLTGYEGESDLLDTADDIVNLAESILKEMRQIKSARRPPRKK